MFCFPLRPIWDLKIHSPSVSSVLADTRSPLQPMWDLTIHPLPGLVSSLTHRLVSGFYSICNSSSPSLVDIVRFVSLYSTVRLMVFKTHLLGRSFPTLIKNALFPSPTDVGCHKTWVEWILFGLLKCESAHHMTISLGVAYTFFPLLVLNT